MSKPELAIVGFVFLYGLVLLSGSGFLSEFILPVLALGVLLIAGIGQAFGFLGFFIAVDDNWANRFSPEKRVVAIILVAIIIMALERLKAPFASVGNMTLVVSPAVIALAIGLSRHFHDYTKTAVTADIRNMKLGRFIEALVVILFLYVAFWTVPNFLPGMDIKTMQNLLAPFFIGWATLMVIFRERFRRNRIKR